MAESEYAPSKTPRYYQLNAINRTVEAIAAGQNRVLLVMATGTGKTYTAFQIIHRLWKSSWRSGKSNGQKRILFLADRNILIDQTMVNDFRPFKGAMAKLSPNAKGVERIDAQGRITVEDVALAVNKTTKLVDKSYEIYLSLYQAVSGTEDEQNIYRQFSPEFFDLIVVDECHRGSADEDSAWREILTYFASATQVGLTATPKETKDISNSDYFGAPLYTYSLKQGIEDGYLNKVLVADEDGVCTTEIIPFRCYGDYVPQYFRLALSSPFFLDYVNIRSYGMKMPRLGTDDARKAVIPLPPLAEQSRIVTRVEELMRLCDALEAKGQLEATQHAQLVSTLLGTLTQSETPEQLAENWQRIATHFDLLLDRREAVDALEQTVLQLAVRGLLVPQDPQDEPASELLKKIRSEKDNLISEGTIKRDKPLPLIAEKAQPFALPVGWEWATLESLASQITDGAHHTPTYVPEGVPFISVKDLSSGVINFLNTRFISIGAHEDLAKRCNPELGDLLLTKIGPTGIALVVNTTQRFSLFVSVALIKLPPISVDRDFLSLVINSPFVRQQSEDGTEGVGNKNLVLRKIKAFQIPLPPLAEQSRIVTRVASLRRLCADLRQRLTTSRSTQAHLAEALIQEAS